MNDIVLKIHFEGTIFHVVKISTQQKLMFTVSVLRYRGKRIMVNDGTHYSLRYQRANDTHSLRYRRANGTHSFRYRRANDTHSFRQRRAKDTQKRIKTNKCNLQEV